MLAESQGVDACGRLAGSAASGAWHLDPTAALVSLVARRQGALPIVLIAGRQIVKVAGYGFVAEMSLDAHAPFAARRRYLETLATSRGRSAASRACRASSGRRSRCRSKGATDRGTVRPRRHWEP
jgi:hypothetical protein